MVSWNSLLKYLNYIQFEFFFSTFEVHSFKANVKNILSNNNHVLGCFAGCRRDYYFRVNIFWNALHPDATISPILVLKMEKGHGPHITDT